MSKTVQGRLIKGFAAQGFSQAANLVIQVFTIPMFLHSWGKMLYGEWLELTGILGYLAISDLSFGSAAQNEMTMRVGRNDRAGALQVFQSAWIVVTGASFTIMLVALLCAHQVPFEHWLKLSRIGKDEAVSVVQLLILQVILAQQGGILVAGYYCDGNYAAGMMTGNLLRLTEFGVSIAVLMHHGRPYDLALAVLLTRILGYAVIMLDLRRRSPWLTLGWRHARLKVLRPLVGPALSFNAFPLGYAFSIQGIVTVIGHLLGPAAVTLFSTSRTFTRLVWQVMNAIGNTVWVELSRAFGAGDLPLARRLHRRACQVALWLALSGSGMLLLLGRPFYHFWTRGRVPFDAGLFHLLLLVIICSSLWSTSYVVPMSINRHQRLALVFISATGLSLLLATQFVRLLGLHGAALALLVGEIVMIVYVVRRSLFLLEDDFAGYLRVVLTPPVVWLWGRAAAVWRRAPVSGA